MTSFTAQDRCDRCGARALHVARKAGAAAELMFCHHHHREFAESLLSQYWLIESDVSPSEPVPAAELLDRR